MNAARIELQAFDFYKRIYEMHTHPVAHLSNLRNKYIHLKDILEQVCHEQTMESSISFANLFARLDYVCRERGISPSDTYSIQTMRRNTNSMLSMKMEADLNEYLYDLRALVRFVSGCYDEPIPQYLQEEIPAQNRPFKENTRKRIPYLRVSVSGWTDSLIYANTDLDDAHSIVINYAKGGYDADMAYLKEILTMNVQLNLLDVSVDEHLHYIPRLIVLNPDFLIDISSLSACFVEYGHHPYNYFLNRLKPRANTHHILMGNLAGRFLDEYVNEEATHPVEYRNTIKRFFATSALEFCTCNIPNDFHSSAQSQMLNIRSFINEKMPHNIEHFDRNQTLLEASFICEKLGLQGRVDMLQKDFKVLIEQKAGKKDEFRNTSREAHFVQMMLYQEVLMYNFGLKQTDIQAFLLYSKYVDGLILEHTNTAQFREAMKLRNYIVALEMASGQGYVKHMLDEINPEMLNVAGVRNKLWTNFQEPQLTEQINVLHNCSPHERAYFTRFYTFIMREMQLAKTGGGGDSQRGFASVWHTPTMEKVETGNTLLNLHITNKEMSAPDKGYDIITMNIPDQESGLIPNFRKGDMVICYTYKEHPDVREHILMKGSIVYIHADELQLRLRNGQQNPDLIGASEEVYAIEHDSSDISASGSIKALYAFLQTNAERKQLLLGQRTPRTDHSLKLNGDYGRFSRIILKEKQAKDYFLLVGPPGTGKTSCALRYMVEEALTDPKASLLLMSYTNRAVDEICDMLVSSGIAERTPFVRIGNELSCDRRFVPYLLDQCIDENVKMTELRQRLMDTRIYVGTTSSLNSRTYLFNLKHFCLAIIDEASQILEPDIIGLLSALHEQENAIDKFILIGDYKQLPAISLQSEKEAAVDDPLLWDLGIDDCRRSLFERLYRRTPEDCRDILNRQGRMHPAIAEFANQTFYRNEKLECVPLPHQEEELPYTQPVTPADNIDLLIAGRRMIFIPAYAKDDTCTSHKANYEEACIVAELVKRIYKINGKDFNPDKTVGVIVPYRNQIALIKNELQKLNIDEVMNLSVDTVERYQGSQRDVIIYSFTIRDYTQLNFLTSNTFGEEDAIVDRKLNVAITRARKQLILTGNPNILGANLTFYKLLEYVKMNNGYVDTDSEHFCRADFEIPGETDGEEKGGLLAPIAASEKFERVYTRIKAEGSYSPCRAQEMECVDYGRWDGIKTPSGQNTDAIAQLYRQLFVKKFYSAAADLYCREGRWLQQTIRNASGRMVICDLAYESGASAMALIDAFGQHLHTDITYVGINPSMALRRSTHEVLSLYDHRQLKTGYIGSIEELPASFWHAHSVVPECIVFNLSNCMDRIDAQQARTIARQIREVISNYKQNHYVTLYRDDAGDMRNIHSYEAFCDILNEQLRPINEFMPKTDRYLYTGAEGHTHAEKYIYEIRTNRK